MLPRTLAAKEERIVRFGITSVSASVKQMIGPETNRYRRRVLHGMEPFSLLPCACRHANSGSESVLPIGSFGEYPASL